MITLPEFVLARNAEREAVARAATPGPWWNESGTVHAPFPFGRDLSAGPGGACHPLDAQGGNGRDADADAEHAALNDPAHVLAWCETVRRIMAFHESWPVLVETPMEVTVDSADISGMTMRATQQIAWLTTKEYRARFGDEPPTAPMLAALALPDASHPDYDPAWAI